MRYFIEFAYRGSDYCGWQIQPNAKTVQGTAHSALQTLLQLPISLVGCGRTDTGVHAKQHFSHFDVDNRIENIDRFIYNLNNVLPNDIAARSVFPVKETAHARFDATSRSYRYYLSSIHDPFSYPFVYRYFQKIDIEAMNVASSILCGVQDFQSFSKVKTEVTNFECHIHRAFWETKEDGYIFNVSANRFLRGMVRTLVGTLLDVGTGKTSIKTIREIIDKKDRKAAGRSVPAKGLFLDKVEYSKALFLND